MTHDQAQKWLARIGGRMIEAKEQFNGRGSIIVLVESATRGTVQRHSLFDDTKTGPERELEIRRAFLRACGELRHALNR